MALIKTECRSERRVGAALEARKIDAGPNHVTAVDRNAALDERSVERGGGADDGEPAIRADRAEPADLPRRERLDGREDDPAEASERDGGGEGAHPPGVGDVADL